jgi:hypothetical protein
LNRPLSKRRTQAGEPPRVSKMKTRLIRSSWWRQRTRTPRVTPLGATTRSGLDSRGPCLRPWLSERLPLPLAHPDGEGRCIYGSCRGTEPHLLGMGYPTFSLESPSWLRSLSTRGSAEERASVRETPLPLRSRTACCTEIRKTEKVIFCADAHATRTEFGRPRCSDLIN